MIDAAHDEGLVIETLQAAGGPCNRCDTTGVDDVDSDVLRLSVDGLGQVEGGNIGDILDSVDCFDLLRQLRRIGLRRDPEDPGVHW